MPPPIAQPENWNGNLSVDYKLGASGYVFVPVGFPDQDRPCSQFDAEQRDFHLQRGRRIKFFDQTMVLNLLGSYSRATRVAGATLVREARGL